MQRRQQIVKLLLAHPYMTYQEMGEIVGCTRQRVHQVYQGIREAGLIGDKKSHLYREDVTVERVLELYRSNMLVRDIARTLGCHANTVTARLRMAGVSPSESYSRRQKLYWRRVSHSGNF